MRAPQGNILYAGGFFDLLNPYALVGGLTTLFLFLTHGAVFLTLKTSGTIHDRAKKIATPLGLIAAVLAVVFLVWDAAGIQRQARNVDSGGSQPRCCGLGNHRPQGWARRVGVHPQRSYLAGAVVYLFWVLFLNVFPASNNPSLPLTIDNASSTLNTRCKL